MASLIPGYEYDIFISYRQKDNKGDRWVSKFVEALKTELEATFKEDVLVYFDENPHDRLQETYDVDKSLEGKLKCLIFIPILSQIYCDPNSYAWQHEFLAFLQLVKNDLFGKDIRLRGGNVASRILPVRIHDLEQEDIKLYEKETSSVLRAVDFVFRTSSGISRPLLFNEDHPNDNLNKTYYRDQISMVAHTIKEIVHGMKAEPVMKIEEKGQVKESLEEARAKEPKELNEKPAKTGRTKFLIPIAIVTLLIIAGIIVYPKVFKQDPLERLKSSGERISVAVMPFQNMTNDTVKWNVYQEIIQNSLTSYLSNFPEDLQIRQTESINDLLNSEGLIKYASITPSFANKVSKKLDADIFIYGSIIKSGDVIRLSAQLIDTKTKEIIRSFNIEGLSIEENFLPKIDSLSRMAKNFLIISKLEKKSGKEQTDDIFYQVSTDFPEAYSYMIYGMSAPDNQTAIDWYKKAISIDSSFVLPYVNITWIYTQSGRRGSVSDYDSAKKWCLKIYDKRDKVPLMQQLMIKSEYAFLFETQVEQNKYLMQILNIDDQQPRTYYILGANYLDMTEYDKAIQALKKGIEVYETWGVKPSSLSLLYDALFSAYHRSGQYKEEKKLLQKAQKEFPDNNYWYRQAILSLIEGDTARGNRYVEEWLSIQKKNKASEASIILNLASLYSQAGMPDKAKEYCRKLLLLQSVSMNDLNRLAYILLFDDRSANEALELAERVLALFPENYIALHRKGWALYKLGKYEEALEFMQKSWNIRINKEAVYNHELYLHLEAAKKAVASQ